ncbi:MAG: SIR2 family protein [Acidobacteriota bacterium]|nr:SIR2 family protein [Acidobacteriota bacterium]
MPATKDTTVTKEQLEARLQEQKRLIKLDQALTEILQTCMNVPKEGRRPFFFIVGAGVSYPPVPLASEIVKECQEEARKYYSDTSDLGATEAEKQMSAYSRWVSKAFPQRGLRQLYFQKKIENQYISDPNLCLAHLLLDNTITNLVVTTNFDDFLSRALTLFNKRHIICDHPRTAQRIDPERVDLLQLIHVHGTYWFYDSSNLREEIEKSASSASQMQPLLANILWNRSPLVVGYGGWENDVIMTSLSRRLESELPYNLYWFCYKYSDALALPPFLYDNPQVYFVVPDKPDAQASGDGGTAGTSSDASARSLFRQVKSAPHAEINPTKAKHDAFSQPADKVLVEMARKFGLQPPPLTKTPLPFFVEHLRGSLPKDPRNPEQEVLDNVFLFKEVIKRIKQAEVANRVVEELAGKYQLELPDDDDNPPDEFIRRLGERMRDGLGQPKAEEAPPGDEAAPAAVAKPEATTTPGESPNVDAVLNALRSHRYVDAITLGKAIQPADLPPKLARDLMDAVWQAALGLYDNSQTEIDAYDAVISIGSHLITADPSNAAATQLLVAKALNNKGFTLSTGDSPEDAFAAFQEVLNRFGDSEDTLLRQQVARALFNIGVKLVDRKDFEEAIATFESALAKAGDAAAPEFVGSVLYNKGFAHQELKQMETAMSAYGRVVEILAETTDPFAREVLANALNNLGYFKMLDAKRHRLDGSEDLAISALQEAQELLRRADSLSPNEALILGNLGYVAFLHGEPDRAHELLTQAISLGGEEIRQVELNDAAINPLPEDVAFREMVQSIPAPAAAV